MNEALPLSRRLLLRLPGIGSLGAAAWAAATTRGAAQTSGPEHPGPSHGKAGPGHLDHLAGAVGRVTSLDPDPSVYLRSFNFSHLPPGERGRYYRESALGD